jgi:hypothetical protein
MRTLAVDAGGVAAGPGGRVTVFRAVLDADGLVVDFDFDEPHPAAIRDVTTSASVVSCADNNISFLRE